MGLEQHLFPVVLASLTSAMFLHGNGERTLTLMGRSLHSWHDWDVTDLVTCEDRARVAGGRPVSCVSCLG